MDIKLFEPTQPQVDALKVMYEYKPAITILNYGRQTGKTYMMMMDAIHWGINNKRNIIMFVSPVSENNSRILNDVIDMFDEHKEIRDLVIKKIKTKEQEIHFVNGSILKFRSAETGNNLRGAKLHRLYLDEAAFIQEWVLTDVLLPMLIRTNGQAILGSTSNHVAWFRKLKAEGLDKDNHDSVYTIQRTYKDLNDPNINKFVEGVLKKRLTKDKYDQEVLNKDVNSEALFHNIEKAMVAMSDEDVEKMSKKQLYGGIDVAMSNDYTVVTIGTIDYEIFAIDRFNMNEDGLDHKDFKLRLLELYHKHVTYIDIVYFEVNNNQLLYEELEDDLAETEEGCKLFDWLTTATTKSKIIQNLIKLFDDEKIKIMDNNKLKTELYGYERSISKISGRIVYGNASAATHDDMVMSLAIYCYCVKHEGQGGGYESY